MIDIFTLVIPSWETPQLECLAMDKDIKRHHIQRRQRSYDNARSREERTRIGRHAEGDMAPEVVGYDAGVFSER